MSSPDYSVDFLKDLLAQQPERKSSGPRKQKDIRDQDSWFKLEHNLMGTCSNSDCLSVASGRAQGRNRVTSIVNDHEMCRFCFLSGWHQKV